MATSRTAHPATTGEASAVILPETEGNVLCAVLRGTVTLQDYQAIDDKMHEMVKKYGSYRYFAQYVDFAGWAPDAAALNFKTINEIGGTAERLAYIDAPQSKVLQVTLHRPLWNGEVRYFQQDERAAALRWIKEKTGASKHDGDGSKNAGSIITLPGTAGPTLCVEFHGTVTRDDYQTHLYDPVARILEQYGYYNLVIHYSVDFEQWEPEAAKLNFRQLGEMAPQCRRVAYVNPTEKKIFQTHMQRAQIGGDVRMFEEGELDQAIAWVNEGQDKN